MGLPVRWTAAPANFSGAGAAHSTAPRLPSMPLPRRKARRADVPNYYHDVPLFMVVEK